MAPPQYRFTSFDLESCLAVAKAIDDFGGLLSSAELAARLDYKSANNGSFNTRLANARLFGLVDGRASALTATDRARAILRPEYPAAAAQARLAAFEAVPLFNAVLSQYHGQRLPDETGMKNALMTRWGINQDKVQMVFARMMDSAEQAGLFAAAGDRSRLIRPTFKGQDLITPSTAGPGHSDVAPSISVPAADTPSNAGVRRNKLIEGVLEMLPDDRSWDESGLTHWMRFFEDALRVYYQLPRHSSADGAIHQPHQEGAASRN